MRPSMVLACAAFGLVQARAVVSQDKTDTFDDLPDTGGHLVGDPPRFTTDGGINYDNFEYFSKGEGTNSLTGIEAHSYPNLAIVRKPAKGSFVAMGKCFTLKKLYFGCTPLSNEAEFNVPLPCQMDLSAYDAAGTLLGTQSANFTPNGLASDMNVAEIHLPPAKVIKVSAKLVGLPTGEGEAVTGLLMDDVTYTQHDNVEDCCEGNWD
ncbi:hypothetical protein VHEMI09086 [[Torrubiella] hemipterigena]|uniref:Secreted protein n=1 Tax=[Torrubiella] hemipterigena TaxID=1531966 RepID=A0A0A1TFE2_9HYPO|nr:hypothetical protein VHEMI09086 [[Torrubiella] hemipterigena]